VDDTIKVLEAALKALEAALKAARDGNMSFCVLAFDDGKVMMYSHVYGRNPMLARGAVEILRDKIADANRAMATEVSP
jgi:hypothetical protein